MLLKEERAKRLEAENEAEILRTILAPLQQKEMDRITSGRTPLEKKNNQPPSMNVTSPQEGDVARELATYVRQKYPEPIRGRIVCDCGCDDHHTHVSYDELDM